MAQKSTMIDYTKLPTGYSFGLQYKDDPHAVAVFPTNFRLEKLESLPKVNKKPNVPRYYFAREYKPKFWNVDVYAKTEGHGILVMFGTKGETKKAIQCFMHSDITFEQTGDIEKVAQTLNDCYKANNIAPNILSVGEILKK